MRGWIDLETAAERLAQHGRQKPFRSLAKQDAKKVLRELRDLIVAGIVNAQVEGDRKRYRKLTNSDALSRPFGINFDLDCSIGAETVFEPGVLRPMLMLEADLAEQLKSAPTAPPSPTIEWLEFKDLKARGVPIKGSQIGRLEVAGKFPKHTNLTPRKKRWPGDEIDDWVANPEKWRATKRSE